MKETDSHKINGAGPQLPKKDSYTNSVFTKVEPKSHPVAPAIAPDIALTLPDSPIAAGPAPQKPKAAAIVIPEKKRS